MRLRRIPFVLLFIISLHSNSIAQSLDWVKTTGSAGTSEIVPSASAVDASKNVITVGTFSGSFDFDPGIGISTLNTLVGISNIYIQKLDSSGNFLWAVSLVGNGNSSVNAVKTDGLGNIYLAGSINSAVDFDPGSGINMVVPTGDQDAFIFKLNANGAPVWIHHFGVGLYNASSQVLAIDNNSDVVISGFFQNSVDFNPGAGINYLNASGWSDNFILKLDAAGNYIYAKSLSGTDYADVKGISIDLSNNILMTGTFYGTVDFDPNGGILNYTSNNSEDIYMLKLNSSGSLIWAHQLGNDGYESVAGIANDNNGNVYIAGSFSDSIDINPGVSTNMLYAVGNSDLMVLQLAANGNFQWGKRIGGLYTSQINSMAIDNNNHFYMAGIFEDVVDFDPGSSVHNLTSMGGYDMFIVSLDGIGNFNSAHRIGGNMDERAVQLTINNANNLFCTGLFKDTVDFDPSSGVTNNIALSTVTQGDQFVFRWDLCSSTSSTTTAYHCDSVLFNGHTYTASGVYTEVINGASGCDSLATLYLTIGNSNSIINHTQCSGSTYVFNGQTYTAPGTFYQYFTNAAGCDSNITINLSFGTPSSYSITDTACDVYFFGSQILYTSGSYTNVLTNASGCDSTIYLHLTIKNSYYGSMSVNSCGPYNFGGTIYTSSGWYTGVFVAANGCDSIIDLDLQVILTSSSTQTITQCKEYVFGGQTYTNSGTYIDTFINMYGCDSIVTLNLTINGPTVNVTQAGITLTAVAPSPATYQWINCTTGNTPIMGATSQSYTATSNGSYAVAVSLNGCTDTSACKLVNGVGIDDQYAEMLIKVYPNPVNENLFVNLNMTIQDASISVKNIVGQELITMSNMDLRNIEIPTKNWAAGTYILTISNGTKFWVHKIVKR